MPKIKKESRFPIIITFILLVLIINTVRSIIDLQKSEQKLTDVKDEIALKIDENSVLQQVIAYVQTEDFIEKAAVENLQLTRPGHTILIVNEVQPEDMAQEEIPIYKALPNWALWLREFGF